MVGVWFRWLACGLLPDGGLVFLVLVGGLVWVVSVFAVVFVVWVSIIYISQVGWVLGFVIVAWLFYGL